MVRYRTFQLRLTLAAEKLAAGLQRAEAEVATQRDRVAELEVAAVQLKDSQAQLEEAVEVLLKLNSFFFEN